MESNCESVLGEAPAGALRESPKALRQDQFGILVEQNLGWLQGWLRGRVDDAELVHDISQEAFLKVFRSLSKLRDPKRFSAWLYRTAQNLLRDHVRRQKRRRIRLVTTERFDGIAAATTPPDPVAGEETVEELLEALRLLPARYREPLLLRHAQDLSYDQIGNILGIKPSAVRVRMFRARQMLRASCARSDG